jgi:hypothetical protein
LKNFYKLFFRLIDPIVNIKLLVLFIPKYSLFFRDFLKFRRKSEVKPRLADLFPCLYDHTKTTGFDRHYIYHTAWAARILSLTSPSEHTDISSSLYFCSIVSAFIPVKFYDYRPAKLKLSNLICGSADLLNLAIRSESIHSLSCMHVVEHIGLGRYGDPIMPDGDIKACEELERVLAKNGNLLFVVPVGKSKIMFNAHRIYSFDQVIQMFSKLKLIEFSLIPDDKEMEPIKNAQHSLTNSQSYGCGCFWFKKL